MAKRVRVGDVVEFSLRSGFGYGQYVQKDPEMGYLLRVMPGVYRTRPLNLNEVVASKSAFQRFFPLQRAVNIGAVRIVGSEPVPAFESEFRVFRAGSPNLGDGSPRVWTLWTNGKWSPASLPDRELRKLPLLGIVNDTWIHEKLEMGWKQEDEI